MLSGPSVYRVVRARSQVISTFADGIGAWGFAAGHLSGVVGCDFWTGLTGDGGYSPRAAQA